MVGWPGNNGIWGLIPQCLEPVPIVGLPVFFLATIRSLFFIWVPERWLGVVLVMMQIRFLERDLGC